MKILFAHEITNYSILKDEYNILYLDYDCFDRIQNMYNTMKKYSCDIDNLFQIILLNKYNIDISKIIIIEFEFFQMKEKFQKLFPKFQYKIQKVIKEKFIKVNPQNHNVFNDILNINIDNIYSISYNQNEKVKGTKLSNSENNIIEKFTKCFDSPFTFYITNNENIIPNHIECIKNAKENKYSNIIIFDFKDDLMFDEKMIKQMIANEPIKIPNDFNICYLSYNIQTNGKRLSYRYNKYLLSIDNIRNTTAYVLNESSYDILINNANPLSNINLYNNTLSKSYGIYPILCKTSNFKDDSRIFYSLNRKVFQTIMINLDRREDRMKKFYKTYGDIYPNVIRFPAVDGKTHDFKNDMNLFDLKDYPLKQKNCWGNHGWKAGTLGCALSHFNVWNKFRQIPQQKDDDFILILEDDIRLCDDFNIKLNDLIDDLDKDPKWQICFLGFTDFQNYNDVKISDKLIKLSDETRNRGGGAFAYLIRKSGARKLVENSLKYKIQQAVDFWIIEQFDDVISYKCEPELVFSSVANNIDGADSDVQNLNQKIINLK
jgi:GR25 family glycosyltransferase involved in LPS biosynthesis